MSELLEMADEEARGLWNNLRLGYTETQVCVSSHWLIRVGCQEGVLVRFAGQVPVKMQVTWHVTWQALLHCRSNAAAATAAAALHEAC
jgi:hypothetical protein